MNDEKENPRYAAKKAVSDWKVATNDAKTGELVYEEAVQE